MGQRIYWTAREGHFGQLYAVGIVRAGLPFRLHVGLQLLKHMYELSDQNAVPSSSLRRLRSVTGFLFGLDASLDRAPFSRVCWGWAQR